MAGIIPPNFDDWRENESLVQAAQQSAKAQNFNWLDT